jgi:F-type H+-transporting ATPase subunit alpha
VLKQLQYQPLPVEKQVIIIYAATNGYLDPVAVEQVKAYEQELYKFLDTRKASLLQGLVKSKAIDDTIKPELNAALEEFGKNFAAPNKAAVA